MIVKIRLATESTVIKSHTMAVARLELVTAWSLGLALPGPGAEAGHDAQDQQPVEGVQAAEDRVIVGEPGEQALYQRRQHHQHGRPGDRAGPAASHPRGAEPATARRPRRGEIRLQLAYEKIKTGQNNFQQGGQPPAETRASTPEPVRATSSSASRSQPGVESEMAARVGVRPGQRLP